MSSGSPILLKIVSENRFSGKTYFYTIASLVPLDGVECVAAQVVAARQVRRLALLQELGDPH